MKSKKETADFYKRLKIQLGENSSWPSVYLYKFIVPSELKKIAQIEAIFNDTKAAISIRESSKGTYTSVSVKMTMHSPDAVIEKYHEVSNIEGVISL
jgi:hypothetical protein